MADRGTLEKLVILAYKEPDYAGEPIGRFESYVNPNEITLSYEMEYDGGECQSRVVEWKAKRK